MAAQYVMQRDTSGWRRQVWISFSLAAAACVGLRPLAVTSVSPLELSPTETTGRSWRKRDPSSRWILKTHVDEFIEFGGRSWSQPFATQIPCVRLASR